MEDYIGGSGYLVDLDLGENEALIRLRKRLATYGFKLMLDFLANYLGPDHPWVEQHFDFFVLATETDIEKNPGIFTRVKIGNEKLILSYCREPDFAGWPDKPQLDFNNPATVEAMSKELVRKSGICDRASCNMAMLVLPDVFEKARVEKLIRFGLKPQKPCVRSLLIFALWQKFIVN